MMGLYAWDFLSPSSTKALVAGDGTPKLNGLVWYYLNRIRYHTEENLVTNASGTVQLRGFNGDYDVTVTYNGVDYPASLTLESDGIQQVVIDYQDAGDQQTTPPAIEDASCRENKPDEVSNWKTLELRSSDGASGFGRVAFLKFDVSNVVGTIQDIHLRLTSKDLSGTVEAYAVSDQTWHENTITWNTMPQIGAMLGSAEATASQTFEIQLDHRVLLSGAGAQNGIVTIALKSLQNSTYKIHSSEADDPTQRPQLIVHSNSLVPVSTNDFLFPQSRAITDC